MMQHNSSTLSFDQERLRRVKGRVDNRRGGGDEPRRSKGQRDEELDEGLSSTWTGFTSPSSASDFEAISDSELVGHPSSFASSSSAAAPPSNLARSLSRPSPAPADQQLPYAPPARLTPDATAIALSLTPLPRSLATLLTLSAHPQTMSPALSHSSLTSLLGAYSPLPGSSSPRRGPTVINNISAATTTAAFDAYARNPHSPFAFALADAFSYDEAAADDDAREFQAEEDARQWEEDPSSTSEEGSMVSPPGSDTFLSDDEGTQLAPRRLSRAIPIVPSRGRSTSDDATGSVAAAPSSASPAAQSKSLPLGPSSATSPPSWSRRLRRRAQRRSSVSPGPASLEERRRARAELDRAGAGPQSFLELVDSSRTFGSGGGGSSGGTAYGGQHQSHHDTPAAAIPPSWTPEGAVSPSSSFPSSDPVLASSIPTIDLSSGAEMDDPIESSRKKKRAAAEGAPGAASGGGWLGWWGRSIELKVWHLVGLAGILIGVGVGLGAASLYKAHRPTRIPLYY
ncbi:hypothetical protein RQP46_000514 [Phenoliferia psychrophenolica]